VTGFVVCVSSLTQPVKKESTDQVRIDRRQT